MAKDPAPAPMRDCVAGPEHRGRCGIVFTFGNIGAARHKHESNRPRLNGCEPKSHASIDSKRSRADKPKPKLYRRLILRRICVVKRALRISLRVLAGLVTLAGATVILCLDGVDNRPYFREAYYARTTAQLQASAETNQLACGELAAGFGRARLSLTVNAPQDIPAQGRFRSLPLAGYGGRHGKPATGVHDDLYVKAVALRVGDRLGVIVGTDALIIPAEVSERAVQQLGREAGLTREQVYLSATHTHSSLGGWDEGKVGEAFAGGFQPEVRVWFSDCIDRKSVV